MATRDHPELAQFPQGSNDGTAEQRILALAWKRVKSDPRPLLSYYLRELARFPALSPYNKFAILPGRTEFLQDRMVACAAVPQAPGWPAGLYVVEYVRTAGP